MVIKVPAHGLQPWSAGLAGWFHLLLQLKKNKKRVKLLNEQLSDAITMLSSSLKAGYSFFQAVDMVAEEMSDPVSRNSQY